MKLPKGTELAIRQVLENTHSASESKRILMRTQMLYNSFIREAPAPGGMNIFRPQYYGGLSVFAFYEAMNRNVEPDVLQEILWRMLLGGGDIRKATPLRFRFSGTWLQKLAYVILRKYAVFTNRKVDSGRWKNTWKFAVNPEGHKNGISIHGRNLWRKATIAVITGSKMPGKRDSSGRSSSRLSGSIFRRMTRSGSGWRSRTSETQLRMPIRVNVFLRR